MKKAQSIVEIALILCIVVVVSLGTWAIINQQKMKLVNMSASTSTQSVTISKTRDEALKLADSMGLSIDKGSSLADILSSIRIKINSLQANSSSDDSELTSYINSYKAILNELAKASAASGNSVKDQVNSLASAMGVPVNGNDDIGTTMNAINSELAKLSSDGQSAQVQDYISQYEDILGTLAPKQFESKTEVTGASSRIYQPTPEILPPEDVILIDPSKPDAPDAAGSDAH